jgi:hypothetical protein
MVFSPGNDFCPMHSKNLTRTRVKVMDFELLPGLCEPILIRQNPTTFCSITFALTARPVICSPNKRRPWTNSYGRAQLYRMVQELRFHVAQFRLLSLPSMLESMSRPDSPRLPLDPRSTKLLILMLIVELVLAELVGGTAPGLPRCGVGVRSDSRPCCAKEVGGVLLSWFDAGERRRESSSAYGPGGGRRRPCSSS